MTTPNEMQKPPELTHRQAMGNQHSPFTTAVSALVVFFAMASCSAKEMGYKDTKHMVSDAWSRVVTALSSPSQQPATPLQTLAPK